MYYKYFRVTLCINFFITLNYLPQKIYFKIFLANTINDFFYLFITYIISLKKKMFLANNNHVYILIKFIFKFFITNIFFFLFLFLIFYIFHDHRRGEECWEFLIKLYDTSLNYTFIILMFSRDDRKKTTRV